MGAQDVFLVISGQLQVVVSKKSDSP